jgi:hypothetical protein
MHTYVQWAVSGDIKKHLSTWLRARGYEIRGGVLEVFQTVLPGWMAKAT